jgi:hypothetical protein
MMMLQLDELLEIAWNDHDVVILGEKSSSYE